MNKPAYIKLFESGELYKRINYLSSKLISCNLCPRNCFVNREKGELGYCGAGLNLQVASAFPHFGEEQPLVCHYGSGTIFLSHCNLKCNFCQNYNISFYGEGEEITANDLVNLMLGLQQNGCHNINFVTPTQFAPQIVAALPKAIEMGLKVPIVWNCGGYESLEVIQLLDGIVDIYMPDAKFSTHQHAKQYANAENYFSVLTEILSEMFRQVGILKIDKYGKAIRGLLIRHLVLPGGVAGSKKILNFIAKDLSTDNYVNIMRQYRPCYQAVGDPLIGRAITSSEYSNVIKLANVLGLGRGFG
jgi:putative pyruvate formate lyase activating enzyme